MALLDILHKLIGLIGVAALGVFLLTIVIGVPCFLVYVMRLDPDSSSQVRRRNYRLFFFAQRIFYVAFVCLLLYQVIDAIRSGSPPAH